MDEDEQQQERVVELVNQIMAVLAGVDSAEAHTALTLSVICAIVSEADDDKDCRSRAQVFIEQVYGYVNRPDILEWVKASMTWVKAGRA